jgi:hypothetical protein
MVTEYGPLFMEALVKFQLWNVPTFWPKMLSFVQIESGFASSAVPVMLIHARSYWPSF